MQDFWKSKNASCAIAHYISTFLKHCHVFGGVTIDGV
jgi:hypothetical protein